MKVLFVFAAVLVAASAETWLQEEGPQHIIVDEYPVTQTEDDSYPEWYMQQPRFRRDVTLLDRKVGDNGKIFGTVGQNSNGLFGRGGYEHNVFNDARGRLDAQAHGTRVLGAGGDSSHFGGGLNWQNSNAKASLDVSRQIHGPSSINAAAGGTWPIGKNGDLSAQGFYDKTSGMRHDHGGRADFNYRKMG